MGEAFYDEYQSRSNMREALAARLQAMDADLDAFAIRLTVDEAEELLRALFELVGHMGADVGHGGYEYQLVERCRHWADQLQVAQLTAAAMLGPRIAAEQLATSDTQRRSEKKED